MKELSYFLLQMTTPEDITAAKSLEMNFRLLRGEAGLENEIKILFNRFPGRFDRPWVHSLLEAIKPFYTRVSDADRESDFHNPLAEFLRHTVRTLNGGFDFWERHEVNLDLNNIPENERGAPHMQWCRLFVERYTSLASTGHPAATILRMCQVHPKDDISDTKALALCDTYVSGGSADYITFSQYIGLYIKSRKNFLEENSQLKPDIEESSVERLRSWDRPTRTVDDHVYWLMQHYDFHEIHHDFLRNFVIKVLGGLPPHSK